MRCPPDERIAAFVDGAASTEAAAQMREHLRTCEACTELVADYATAFGLASGSAAATHGSIDDTGPSLRDALELREGDRFARYVVLMLAGRGGMGEVYVAYDPELDRKLALKIVSNRRASRARPGAEDLLLAEARLAASLHHPNVVEIFDVGIMRGRAYIAMEYVEGLPLSRWSTARERSAEDIIAVFVAAANGLQAAHDVGIVHRDFKPSNVLVGRDGRVRIADFGLASAGSDEGARGIVGTPGYMAPEQWRGREADARADQYAFCVAMFEALHGECPDANEGRDARARSRISGRRARRIDAVLRRGLALAPDDRWPSMRALVAALPRARAPRRTTWIATAGAAIALAIGVGLARDEPAPVGCGGEERLAAVWGPTERQAMRTGILAAGTTYAESAADAAERALDQYATRWLAAHDDLCAASTVQAPARECLHSSLAELHATAEVLTDADPGIAARAVAIARGLPEPGACTGADARERLTVAEREEVARIEAQLARANALQRGGKIPEAAALVDTALVDAERARFTPLTARIRHSAGAIASRMSQFDRAAELLEGAAWLAAQAGDDASHIDALAALIVLEGAQRSRPDTAAVWSKRARDALRHAGSPPELEQPIVHAEGSAAAQQGDTPRAIALLERSAELAEALHGADDPRLADTLQALGIARLRAGQYRAADQATTRAQSIVEASYGGNHPKVADMLDVRGAVATYEGDPERAREHAERALRITEAAYGAHDLQTARRHHHLGMCLDDLGESELAREHLDAAVAVMEATSGPDDFHLVGTLDARGVVHYHARAYDRAEADLRRAIAIAGLHERQAHPDTSTAWSHLGDVLRLQGRLDDAAEAHRAALSIRRTLGHAHLVAASLEAMARVETARSDFVSARALQDEAVTQWTAALGDDHPYTVAAREEAARLSVKKK